MIRRLTEAGWRELSAALYETGDIGAAAQVIVKKNQVRRQATLFGNPLTLLEVRSVLEAVPESTGQGSIERKERLIESLYGRASPVEAKNLVDRSR